MDLPLTALHVETDPVLRGIARDVHPFSSLLSPLHPLFPVAARMVAPRLCFDVFCPPNAGNSAATTLALLESHFARTRLWGDVAISVIAGHPIWEDDGNPQAGRNPQILDGHYRCAVDVRHADGGLFARAIFPTLAESTTPLLYLAGLTPAHRATVGGHLLGWLQRARAAAGDPTFHAQTRANPARDQAMLEEEARLAQAAENAF